MVRYVALATPQVVDEHVLPQGRIISDDSCQAGGEKIEERLDSRGREPIGRWVDDIRSRLHVVGDVVKWLTDSSRRLLEKGLGDEITETYRVVPRCQRSRRRYLS